MSRRPKSRMAEVALIAGGLALTVATFGAEGPLDEAVPAAIAEALQDEYHGEAIYARALKDHGEIRPFSRVVHAEQRHAGLLEKLLTERGLDVPENRWAKAEVPAYASVKEACAAAVEFEVRNVALYDRLLAGESLPDDVRTAFAHNRMASLEHHKPAFERCAGWGRSPGRGARDYGRGGWGRGQRGCGHLGCGHCGCGWCAGCDCPGGCGRGSGR